MDSFPCVRSPRCSLDKKKFCETWHRSFAYYTSYVFHLYAWAVGISYIPVNPVDKNKKLFCRKFLIEKNNLFTLQFIIVK